MYVITNIRSKSPKRQHQTIGVKGMINKLLSYVKGGFRNTNLTLGIEGTDRHSNNSILSRVIKITVPFEQKYNFVNEYKI